MESEKDITRLILKELSACGCFAFKHWGGPMGRKGVSDILGVLPVPGGVPAFKVAPQTGAEKFELQGVKYEEK
jgi:hypothetical protein